MQRFLTLLCILVQTLLHAQITDDFSDGNFSLNQNWSGSENHYLVNSSAQVQLNNSIADSSYLSTPHGLTDFANKEWKIWTKQSFSPSGSNFGRIYLTATNPDLKTNPDGIYLQLGEAGSNDAVRLYKVVSGVHTQILSASTGLISSSFVISIRVIRDDSSNWSLYIDYSGGENYVLESTINDPSLVNGAYFGWLNVYTMSNATKFYYDNIYVGEVILDLSPPSITTVSIINENQIDVIFDEPIEQASAENNNNYLIQPNINVGIASLDFSNSALVHIELGSPLINGVHYTLNTSNLSDLNGNISGLQSSNFLYIVPDSPLPGDVIINEFLCDPTPSNGLPEAEFVEIYNKSNKIFDISGWKLGDGSSTGTIQFSYLYPGEYRTLTSTSNSVLFINAVAVSNFPSLNNSGDKIILKNNSGTIIDEITYTDDWYKDPMKSSGGYTIERINPNDPCSDASDWSASVHPFGGTPGVENSIYNPSSDSEPPIISGIKAYSPNYIDIFFNEKMDSAQLRQSTIISSPSLSEQYRWIHQEYAEKMTIQFNELITPSLTYFIELVDIADCWLNINTANSHFILAELPQTGDLVINEILFNPVTGGSDWIEIYNNSPKIINLKGLSIANYDNSISNIKTINVDLQLVPDQYVVLTKDSNQVRQQYPAFMPGTFIQMELPAFNNDSSTVYLLKGQDILDKVSYSEKWHFKLIDDPDGKSLERIDANNSSNQPENWHTAAESIGFGTPGAKNSQFRSIETNGNFLYLNETVSPDNDGFEDVLLVSYEFNQPGLVGNFTVYDDFGRLISKVMLSELLNTKGTFYWDGLRENQTKASIGIHVGVFEVFSIDGQRMFYKKRAFVVGGKM